MNLWYPSLVLIFQTHSLFGEYIHFRLLCSIRVTTKSVLSVAPIVEERGRGGQRRKKEWSKEGREERRKGAKKERGREDIL